MGEVLRFDRNAISKPYRADAVISAFSSFETYEDNYTQLAVSMIF